MGIRMSGLVSGMDTEGIIKELMNAQSQKKTKIEKSKTKLEWKEEKWAEINKKIYALYTEKLGSMKLQGSYQTRKVASTIEGKATATATAKAANGTYALKVNKLAAAQYVTGSNIKSKGLTASSTLEDAGMQLGTEITIKTGSGATTLVVEEETRIQDLLAKMGEAGLNATFDSGQGRFFIGAADSGLENKFTITTSELTTSESTARDTIAEALDFDNLSKGDQKKVETAFYYLQNGTLQEQEDAEDALSKILENTDRQVYQSVLDNGMNALKSADTGNAIPAGFGLDAIGLGEITDSVASDGLTGTGMSVISASDSEIELNGAVLTGNSNTITVNGLTIQITGTTAASETIGLTVSNDTEANYDMVKDFINSYNELIIELNVNYSAKAAKGYEPLTEEERSAMSDKQAELWDEKIKTSLLRRDSTLDSLMSAMRSAMQTTVEVNGETYSLATLGIVTGEYTERGALHIEGDKEDSLYMDKKNKLQEALTNDPELVAKLMSGVSAKLYDTLTEEMKSSTISSALTVYNDKQMNKQIDEYEKQIKEWNKRLATMENKYYKQFTAMETSLQSLQSQQSSMAGLFGK